MARHTNVFTNAVMMTLQTLGYDCWRNNTHAVFDPTVASEKIVSFIATPANRSIFGKAKVLKKSISGMLSKSFRKPNHLTGVSDICGVHKKTGRALFVEIKCGKDRESPYQKNFRIRMVRNGAIAIVVTDKDLPKKGSALKERIEGQLSVFFNEESNTDTIQQKEVQ